MCMGECVGLWVSVYVYGCVSMCMGKYLSLWVSVYVYESVFMNRVSV
jgi:hypothetical protein